MGLAYENDPEGNYEAPKYTPAPPGTPSIAAPQSLTTSDGETIEAPSAERPPPVIPYYWTGTGSAVATVAEGAISVLESDKVNLPQEQK